jgi:hypothetical protein
MQAQPTLRQFLRCWLVRAPDFTTAQLMLVRLLDAMLGAGLIRLPEDECSPHFEGHLKAQLEKAGASEMMIRTVPEILSLYAAWRIGAMWSGV